MRSLYTATVALALLCVGGGTTKARTLTYGRHFPNGQQGHDTIKGPNGTWRETSGIAYTKNYYWFYAHAGHPFDRRALIHEAQTLGQPRTARDANGHLLFDADGDLALDTAGGGRAFCEHAGMGADGDGGAARRTSPFKQFWFDDNWCAREMCKAYGSDLPRGLHAPSGFIRWSALDGGVSNYRPYNGDYVDQDCLDGLHRLGQDNTAAALAKWRKVAGKLPDENYHIGLQLCLGGHLLDDPAISAADREGIVQRWVELRRVLLNRQLPDGTWRSSEESSDSLVNTETVALASIGLAADAIRVYEAGVAPSQHAPKKGYSYVADGHYVEAEREDDSGHLVYGPYDQLRGAIAQFAIRSYGVTADVCRVEVVDAEGRLATSKTVTPAMVAGEQWKLIELPMPSSARELRVWYHSGSCDKLHVAFIRVK